jgi:hypothetical protein
MLDSLDEARTTVLNVTRALATVKNTGTELFDLADALLQTLDTAEVANAKSSLLIAGDITDIGERALQTIDDMVYILVEQDLQNIRYDIQQVAVLIARWVIEHGGQLTLIQSVVDGLAYLANALQEPESLAQLAGFMNQIAAACSENIRHDLDNAEPSRPWRTLNMNRGIVATRSHDTELMHEVFEELIDAIPMDAPDFFKQGMSEMVRLNYPKAVHAVMKQFYDRIELPARH